MLVLPMFAGLTGHHCMAGSTTQIQCVAGRFSPEPTTPCTPCASGRFQPSAVQAACRECVTAGSSAVCPLDGQSNPLTCADANAQPAQDVDSSNTTIAVRCECKRGFYGALDASLSANTATRQQYNNMTVWHLQCWACPSSGVQCSQTGLLYDAVVVLPGFWQSPDFFRDTPELLSVEGVEVCLPAAVQTCGGGPWKNNTCVLGYSGILCTHCDMGPKYKPTHYRGATLGCIPCDDSKRRLGWTVVLLGLLLPLFLHVLWGTRPCASLRKKVSSCNGMCSKKRAADQSQSRGKAEKSCLETLRLKVLGA